VTGQLCAVCVNAPATHPDIIDGRAYRVCLPCRGDGVEAVTVEPVRAPSMKQRVFGAVVRGGRIPSSAVSDMLGLHSETERNHVSQTLTRLVTEGKVRREGGRNERVYYPAEAA
jgi:hypothetical protein